MALTSDTVFHREPTDLQCGQAVIAMLAGCEPGEVAIYLCNDRETTLAQMFAALEHYDIMFDRTRRQAETKEQLPSICLLSLETPRCWHWSLFRDGIFYDPEHGVMADFPKCKRKYYWTVYE